MLNVTTSDYEDLLSLAEIFKPINEKCSNLNFLISHRHMKSELTWSNCTGNEKSNRN